MASARSMAAPIQVTCRSSCRRSQLPVHRRQAQRIGLRGGQCAHLQPHDRLQPRELCKPCSNPRKPSSLTTTAAGALGTIAAHVGMPLMRANVENAPT